MKFLRTSDAPNTARVKLLMYNITGRPIIYKLKSKTKSLLTADPSACGTIPAHGIDHCLLIWRLPANELNWENVKPTSIVMITEFEGSNDPVTNEHTKTKIKCIIIIIIISHRI
ncbi:unnamed protein product [Thelazia callipaeda]|uniref:MMS1_N domain-containing protein n=1 Tax=Thelazia callipaeda TaxID=103827 RepID=A0A0N5CQ45_THECL|nr:unnamed protein product [Thelazia callipaeda]